MRDRVLATVTGGLIVAGCWSILPNSAPIGIALVTLDTTRADRLSPYGFMDVALPHLERLAREGLVFDRTTSVAPLTLPAHCSIFTGLLPFHHGVRDNGDSPLAESQVTLAETLGAHGFHTGAFVGSEILAPDRGLAQGFHVYRSASPDGAVSGARFQRRADAVVTDAMDWLRTIPQSERFFLWVHLYDPHRPYDPPEPFRSKYLDPYVGEIAYADSQIGRLIDALERRKQFDRTIVVVVGDHGESLGEHGERDHGVSLYESVLRVPLIMRVPKTPPQRVGELVRLTDLTPTLLALLGVRSESDPGRPPSDGVNLTDLITGRRANLELEGYAESVYPERFGGAAVRSLRDRRFKFIDAPSPALYDLDRDPFEERNLYDARRSLAIAMKHRLTTLTRTDLADRAARPQIAPEVRERLAALGYVNPQPRPRD
ncbi:MAG: sulfatase [Vicinamibacterales bacterium]